MPRALVIQLRQFGDVLLTEPAIELLTTRGYTVDIVTETVGDWVCKGNDRVNQVYLWDRSKGKPQSMLGLVRTLRSKKYDLLIDFQALPKTLLLGCLLGAKKRLGMTRSFRRHLYHSGCFPDGTYPALQKTRFVAENLGLKEGDFSEDQIPRLYLSESEKKKAESFFEKVKARAKRKKTIVVCPVSRQPYKVLEPAKMAKLCSALIAQGYYLFAIYGPGQKEQVAAVNECMGKERVELIENKLSLREWMGVLQRCGAYVGVDGGHKHLAISAEIPTFTLYHNVPPFWHPPKLRSHSFLDLTPQGESSPTIEHVIQEVSQFLQQSV